MTDDLRGRIVAFLVANEGVEEVELTRPWEALDEAGAELELIAPEGGEVQTFSHLDKGDTFAVTRPIADADAERYDALVLPGGVANPDVLRTVQEAVAFTGLHVDSGLVTSRKPDDLDAFCVKAIEEIAEGIHSGQREATAGARG